MELSMKLSYEKAQIKIALEKILAGTKLFYQILLVTLYLLTSFVQCGVIILLDKIEGVQSDYIINTKICGRKFKMYIKNKN